MSNVDIKLLSTFVYLFQCLGPALIDIKKMCYQISDTGLCHIEKEHIYTLQEFREFQFKQLQEVTFLFIVIYDTKMVLIVCRSLPSFFYYCQVKNDLVKFQDLVKEVTICACRNYLKCIRKEEDEGVHTPYEDT